MSFFLTLFSISISPSRPLLQYVPVPEVSGGVGVSSAGRLCAGVQVRVPVALLAFHSKRLRLLQISGTGKSFPPGISLQAGGGLGHIWLDKQQRFNAVHLQVTWQINYVLYMDAAEIVSLMLNMVVVGGKPARLGFLNWFYSTHVNV